MNLTEEQKKAIELYRNMCYSEKLNLEYIFGKELFKEQKDIRERVKSWEDAFEMVKPRYYLATNGEIDVLNEIGRDDVHFCGDNVPSEKHAKSVLAYCKLLVIVEALNEGWKADKNTDPGYTVYYGYKEYGKDKGFIYRIQRSYDAKVCNLDFKSEQLAQHLIDNFSDLLKDYFMID